jgi:hypothetical protein
MLTPRLCLCEPEFSSFRSEVEALSAKYCTVPLNLWTDQFSFVTSLFVKTSVASEAPLPKGSRLLLFDDVHGRPPPRSF